MPKSNESIVPALAFVSALLTLSFATTPPAWALHSSLFESAPIERTLVEVTYTYPSGRQISGVYLCQSGAPDGRLIPATHDDAGAANGALNILQKDACTHGRPLSPVEVQAFVSRKKQPDAAKPTEAPQAPSTEAAVAKAEPAVAEPVPAAAEPGAAVATVKDGVASFETEADSVIKAEPAAKPAPVAKIATPKKDPHYAVTHDWVTHSDSSDYVVDFNQINTTIIEKVNGDPNNIREWQTSYSCNQGPGTKTARIQSGASFNTTVSRIQLALSKTICKRIRNACLQLGARAGWDDIHRSLLNLDDPCQNLPQVESTEYLSADQFVMSALKATATGCLGADTTDTQGERSPAEYIEGYRTAQKRELLAHNLRHGCVKPRSSSRQTAGDKPAEPVSAPAETESAKPAVVDMANFPNS